MAPVYRDYVQSFSDSKAFCPCYATAGVEETLDLKAFTQGPHAVIRTHPKDSIITGVCGVNLHETR